MNTNRSQRYIQLFCILVVLMIALTVSAAAYEASPADWDFSTIGNTEGWTANDSVQEMFVQDGNLCIHIHGDSPAITANSIAVKASDFNVIDIRMKNETDSTTAALQWTTSADGIMDSKKTALFAIESNSSDVKEYHVQLSGNEEWSGTITSLRLVFQSSSGYIGIDEIRFDVCNRPAVEYIGSINPISADETTISVTGVIAADNDQTAVQLKLYELAPYQYEQDISDLIPVSVQSAPMNGNVFLFSIPRYDGQRDRVYSKFVVVQQFVNTQELQFVAAPRYVTDIQFAAENSFSYPIIETKKGLLVEMTDDAEELGIDHAIVNVEFSTMMYEENLNPNDTIIFQMDGTNYYFSKSYFESLDKKIKPLSDNGVIVNLVLILYPNFPDNSMTEVLHHPNAVMGTGGGGVLAFNTAEEAGVQAFKAAMEFLSRRYTRDDQLYGRALGFIVGNEVDAQWEWQNMGYTTLDQFVEQYEPALRIAYMATQKYYKYARVYTSLTNHWMSPYDSNPLKGYAARKVIDKLNWQSKQNGDFPWNVAYHPYPEDFFNADTWNDERATDSVDSELLTFKNIHILNDYMGNNSLRFGSEKRRIILSEQGFHTANSSLEAQKEQAAAYAYAYYKTAFLDGIDAFCLFSHVDIPSYGLNMGLWTQDASVTTPMVAKEKKYIYDVFKKIDTDQSLQVTNFAKSIIGISSWADVVSDFEPDALQKRTVPQEYTLVNEPFIPGNVLGNSFETGTEGWRAADNTNEVVHTTQTVFSGTGAISAEFNARALNWRGAEKHFASSMNMEDRPFLHLAYQITGEQPSGACALKIKVYSGLEAAEGIIAVDSAEGWHTLCMNLTDWSGLQNIDRIKVLVRSEGTDFWAGSLMLDDIGFSNEGVRDNNNTDANTLPSNEKILFNFENSLQEWCAGANVSSVTSVQTMQNAPFIPALGEYMLEAVFPTYAANAWRSIEVMPEYALNFMGADGIAYAINGYGGSGGNGYETRIRLFNNEHMFEKCTTVSADSWNQIYVDLSGWNWRNNITKIEISYRATGTTAVWYGSRFQVDMIRLVEHDNLENEVDLKERSMQPFWQGTTMYNESILMVSHDGGIPEGKLLFQPTEILSVRSARLDQEYEEGVDWILEDGKIKRTVNSRIPYLSTDDLYFPSYIPGLTMPKKDGGAVLYREESYFHDRQIVVTYTHAENAWNGPIPQLADDVLQKTFYKLRNGEPLKIVLYGDSISDGSNSSGFVNAPPYLPIWGRLAADTLEKYYGTRITFVNKSVGGTASQWGAEQTATRVVSQNPDLVIIAFGMNDGAGTGAGDGVRPQVFKENIQSIINQVRAANPSAEFILVGTTLPNAETICFDQQPYYFEKLQEIADSCSGIATANMTEVHRKLLERKSFADMTANNVNHPNDFLARWYAQYIVGMLKDSTFSSDRPLNARRLFSFENGVQGWSAGENVSTVNTVRSFANWPFAPQEGSCALEAEFPTQEANAWRTIMISLEEPLNLSEAGCVYYHINSYGGSGGTGYETRIRLYSGSNMKEEIKAMQADSWNYICTDVASWPYKDNITKIEIAFRATGSTAAWYGSRFQIDNVGYLLEGTLLYDFEGTTHSWMGTENVMSVNSVAAFANSPMKPVSNAYALEALFPDMALNEWRTIAVEYDQMLDLSEATHFYYYINSYGGSGGSGYETRLRLYSENDVWEQTVSMDADMWNRIEANIGNWSGRGHITKIEIAFRAIGSNAVWYSSRFQIDKVGYRKVS